jgi:AcrR family transcriptional regulator
MAGPRGEYRKSAERRAQILEAAFTVFAKNGYTASSVNEIARAVGMTQTGVLHHFAGGKIALMRAVMEQRDARSADSLAGLHGRDFLAGLVQISRVQAGQRGVVQLYRTPTSTSGCTGSPMRPPRPSPRPGTPVTCARGSTRAPPPSAPWRRPKAWRCSGSPATRSTWPRTSAGTSTTS